MVRINSTPHSLSFAAMHNHIYVQRQSSNSSLLVALLVHVHELRARKTIALHAV